MPIRSEYWKTHSNLTDIEYICLVAQGGLLRCVTPNLRAVSVDIVNEDVIVYGIFDGLFTDEERDNIECVATEVFASIVPPSNAIALVSRCDYPNPLKQQGKWVYMRYEP